jgi:hypothetical protein
MRAKLLAIASTTLLALAGCTQDANSGGSEGVIGKDAPLVGTERGPLLVRPGDGSILFEGAVAAPDGSRVYSTSADDGSTRLDTMDALSGDPMGSTRVRGDLEVRVASVSGDSVAMMDPLPPGADAWTPVPRTRTSIVVADPSGERDPRRYRLEGNFEPEAFSSDDSRLFLIQYLPADDPSIYRVMSLKLADGGVRQVFGRFKVPPQRMPGVRLTQVLAPDAQQLYTLYTNQPSEYADEYGGQAGSWGAGDEPVSFIHVLNLGEGWAYCAGLPRAFWGQPAETQAISVSPDGDSLYIVNSMLGKIAEMDTRKLEIVRTEEVPFRIAGQIRTSAQMSSDGSTLFVGLTGKPGSAVEAVDTESLGVDHHWPMSGVVSGLGLSGDGQRLFVALDDRVAVLEAATGEQLGAVPSPGVESIVRIGALAA